MTRSRKRQPAARDPRQEYLTVKVADATEAQLAHAERAAERAMIRHKFHRRVMEWLNAPSHCPRKACRRAGACKSPEVVCYDAARPYLLRHVLPGLRKALKKRMSEQTDRG